VIEEQTGMNQVLLDWGEKLREWEEWAAKAATLKATRDNKIVALKTKQKAADPKIAESWAKTIAEADEDVQQWNLEQLVAEANVDAIRKRLDWFEMRAKAAQTNVATAREEARVWAAAPSVPGRSTP
jgi:hypothetical protein